MHSWSVDNFRACNEAQCIDVVMKWQMNWRPEACINLSIWLIALTKEIGSEETSGIGD